MLWSGLSINFILLSIYLLWKVLVVFVKLLFLVGNMQKGIQIVIEWISVVLNIFFVLKKYIVSQNLPTYIKSLLQLQTLN